MEAHASCGIEHMMRWGHGLVIGKFYPPHRGHSLLIQTALDECERVTVIVCDHISQTISGEARAHWLRTTFPRARVISIPDDLPDDRSDLWAQNTISILGTAPDVVFTSEGYGDAYASHMGCDHRSVDPDRVTIPISATTIRKDVLGNLDMLEPPVRAAFVKRICIVGAESTGTTTLAQALAAEFNTNWVPEYGREYWIRKLEEGTETEWTTEDFFNVAFEQARREDLAAQTANKVLFCDTDPLATSIWHERYLKRRSPELEIVALARNYILYILTGDEIPFVQDGFRDGEHIRHWMHSQFVARFDEFNIPYLLVSGSHEARLELASEAIRKIILASQWPTTRSF